CRAWTDPPAPARTASGAAADDARPHDGPGPRPGSAAAAISAACCRRPPGPPPRRTARPGARAAPRSFPRVHPGLRGVDAGTDRLRKLVDRHRVHRRVVVAGDHVEVAVPDPVLAAVGAGEGH